MATKQRPLRFIDAFAGCGGLSLGLSQAGLQGVFAIEHNESAFETFQANFLHKDARQKFKWPAWLPKSAIGIDTLLKLYRPQLTKMRGEIDLLAGGPPCQGFSSAGRRRSDDPRNQLFKSYLRLVELLKPTAVLIENVRGFTIDFDGEGHDNYSAKLVAALSKEYVVSDTLLNLARFGVPQNRTRYFVLAFRKGTISDNPFDALEKMLPSYLRSIGLSAPVSSRAAISDLEVSRCGTKPSTETPGFSEICYSRPLSRYQKLMSGAPGAPSDVRLANHAPSICKRFASIISICHAEGRLNTSISNEMREQFGLKKRALRVLDPESPSPTITSMPDDLLHYKEPRILTVRENARLQSFPDWFSFKGKYTTGGERRRHEVPRYTQVANAVPPLAARAFGILIIEMLANPKPQQLQLGHRLIERIAELAEV